MPVLNRNKCYAQQPQRVNITVPENLPYNWLADFREQLATLLDLGNKRFIENERTQKEQFFYDFNRHTGSGYSKSAELNESLKRIYCFYIDPKTTPEQKHMIAKRISEDAYQCSPGFDNRVKFILTLLNEPTTLDELLAQVRFHLVDKIASIFSKGNTQGVHVHNRIVNIAQQSDYGVWALNEADTYRNTGSSNISDEKLQQLLKEGFDRYFRLFGILNRCCEQLEVFLAPFGYEGPYTDGREYKFKQYSEFDRLINKFTSIQFGDLTIIDKETNRIVDINWQNVKRALLQTLRDKNYITLTPEEDKALTDLPKITNQTSLISNHQELAECLTVFSSWTMEEKVALVMAYIKDRTFNDQEAVLNVLDDEVPQLTAQLKLHTAFQPLYFQIAVQKKQADAVRVHIEQGADINAALGLLFSEDHKCETLFWLYEHQDLIKKITPDSIKPFEEILKKTKKGREILSSSKDKNVIMLDGLFKRPDPLATQLCQYVAYGDLTKAEKILKDHPDLAKKLLNEKVTVTDYSGRNFKHKTAFQIALCAWDVKLNVGNADPEKNDPDAMCETLAKYMENHEVKTQYDQIFPEGHQIYFEKQKEEVFNFKEIIDAITNAGAEDVQTALDLIQPNETALWKALEKFRKEFTELSKKEIVWNPQHLLKAFEEYDSNYSKFGGSYVSPKNMLFWRQIIGYTQRFLPANIAMDVAQGLYYRVDTGAKPKRKFAFLDGDGAILPLSQSLSGLGYERAAEGFEAGRWTSLDGAVDCSAVTKLMSSKNSNIGKLMQPGSNPKPASTCLIV